MRYALVNMTGGCLASPCCGILQRTAKSWCYSCDQLILYVLFAVRSAYRYRMGAVLALYIPRPSFNNKNFDVLILK
jgi:hypothetical protein